jgi:hypothetical protein
MKVLGRVIKGMEKVMKGTQTGTSMKESSRTVKHMAEEFTYGPMERSMMESGSMGQRMDMESGLVSMGIHTLGSGRTAKQKGMGCTHGRMGISMRESGSTV